jgi:hypothetical protein
MGRIESVFFCSHDILICHPRQMGLSLHGTTLLYLENVQIRCNMALKIFIYLLLS